MHGPGINGEGELRGQLANPGSPEKMAIKTECVCVCVCAISQLGIIRFQSNLVWRRKFWFQERSPNKVSKFCKFAGQSDE